MVAFLTGLVAYPGQNPDILSSEDLFVLVVLGHEIQPAGAESLHQSGQLKRSGQSEPQAGYG